MTALRYDLIAFDWDGTLFDSTALITQSIQAAVRDVGGRVPSREQAAFVIGMGLAQALAHAAPDVPVQRHPDLAERYRYHYFGAQHTISLFDGVVPMLAELHARGHQLAVATGKSRRGLAEALVSVGLQHTFAATRTAEQTASKPDPQMLLELMDELGVPPTRTLMVGDTTHDLAMAARAGCASLAVSYGAHDPAEFADHAPLAVLPSVAALHTWLREHG